jgi:predicted permease
MWFVVVIGYSLVGMLAVWNYPLAWSDTALPLGGFLFICACTAAGLLVARLVSRDNDTIALIGLSGGMGNAASTMGGFLCFLFFNVRGQPGLELSVVYCLMWYPFIVLVAYPIAHHYSAGPSHRVRLPRLMWRSLWDIRSIGLPLALAGVALSAWRVPRPAFIGRLYITESLTILTTILAFFAIGLRVRGDEFRGALGPSVIVGIVRFGLCPLIGLGLYALMSLSPWPLTGLPAKVYLLETCLPLAITVVGIANLFDISPRRATAIFILNTLSYLVLCVPVLWWIFGR